MIILKLILGEQGVREWKLAKNGVPVWGVCDHGNKSLGTIKRGDLDQLSN
jgi:hypothetical protein